jgi:hypothetical protein
VPRALWFWRALPAAAVALAIFLPGAAAAAAAARPGEELSIHVVTMGPGDHPFFKFGHNAIWVQNLETGRGAVYNFGTFKFDSPKLIPVFLRGRLMYWLSRTSIQTTIATYRSENRSIETQELDLDPAARAALRDALELNARPENRAYKYDYFLDNCSTRVRDAVDRATGGRLRAVSEGKPGRLTLRQQALRLTADLLPEYLALYLLLGASTDKPIDRWGEMFIPEEVQKTLREVRLPAAAVDGAPEGRPLVKSEAVAFSALRPPPLRDPPSWGAQLLLAGVAIGLLLALGGLGARRSVSGRVAFGAVIALVGFFLGFLGSFLVFVWGFTDHLVAHRNENILQLAPFTLALAVMGVGVAMGRRRPVRWAFSIAGAAAALGILGLLLKVTPWFSQDNLPLIGLLLPVWVGMAVGLWIFGRGGTVVRARAATST